jgi:hypothetical protein
VRHPPGFAYVVVLLIGFYVVVNETTRNLALFAIGIVLLLWSLRQIWTKRFRGLLAVTALCAVLAGVAYAIFAEIPTALFGVWIMLAALWATREIVEWLQRILSLAARRWRERPRIKWKRAPRERKLEPAVVAVPGQAGNVSADEIIKRLVLTPQQRKAS